MVKEKSLKMEVMLNEVRDDAAFIGVFVKEKFRCIGGNDAESAFASFEFDKKEEDFVLKLAKYVQKPEEELYVQERFVFEELTQLDFIITIKLTLAEYFREFPSLPKKITSLNGSVYVSGYMAMSWKPEFCGLLKFRKALDLTGKADLKISRYSDDFKVRIKEAPQLVRAHDAEELFVLPIKEIIKKDEQ